MDHNRARQTLLASFIIITQDLLQPLFKLSPQTDGRIERTNQTLEQYLCCFICYQQDDWADILHFSEFSYSNLVHSSSKVTPFFAYRGHEPRCNFLELLDVPTNR